jgi:transposase-like protein
MEAKKMTPNRLSPEVRERAVRMVLAHQGGHASQLAAVASIAGKIGCTGETLRGWLRQAERDAGSRAGGGMSIRPGWPGACGQAVGALLFCVKYRDLFTLGK